jgi:hypothetical protein
VGLDPQSRRTLSNLLHRLATKGSPRVFLALGDQEPVPEWITYVLYIGPHFKIAHQGKKADVYMDVRTIGRSLNMEEDYNERPRQSSVHSDPREPPEAPLKVSEYTKTPEVEAGEQSDDCGKELIYYKWNEEEPWQEEPAQVNASTPRDAVVEMQGIKVQYDERVVLGVEYLRCKPFALARSCKLLGAHEVTSPGAAIASWNPDSPGWYSKICCTDCCGCCGSAVMTLGRVAGQVPDRQIPAGARESLMC